jgi:hypothetical protein
MDVASLAAAMIGAQAGRTQMAVAAKMLKMSIGSEASVLQLLQAGQQDAGQLANAAAGLGQNLDITV